jgi:GT2 family glycosyltransferase
MTRFEYNKKLIPLPALSTKKELFLKASNEITGNFVAVIRAGDRLHQTALYECAAEIDLYPQTQALYTDEDALDAFGDRVEPCFKPDWNVELFLGQNYVGGFCFISRERFCAFTAKNHIETLEAVNFYALLDAPRETVRHIPAVLYHRHVSQQKDVWTGRSQALAQSYLDAQGIKAETGVLAAHPYWIEVRRKALDPSPLVTIIIPTRNRPDLLSVCLRGVLNETHYKNVEVIIVDHENDHPQVFEIFKSYLNDARVTVLPYRGVFDHSDMNNRAAQIARGDILLFLNDDIEVIEPGWLTHMVAQFAQVDRGVVGARLLYPSRRIQHAGVVLGLGGVAGHGFVGLDADDAGYYGRLKIACEVSALTGACMAMRRALFEEVGGFSARHLQRTFNDVDLCLKARARGKVNIYTPLATLIHHESATDGGDVKLKQFKRLQGEVGYMLETWGLMRSDPYYNVNLALEGESFSLAFPPRRVAPWQAVGIS